MSHLRREFEKPLENINGINIDASVEKPLPASDSTAYLDHLKEAYGITKRGKDQFEITIDGTKHTGQLKDILSMAQGQPNKLSNNPFH